jgi:hypothetical protein
MAAMSGRKKATRKAVRPASGKKAKSKAKSARPGGRKKRRRSDYRPLPKPLPFAKPEGETPPPQGGVNLPFKAVLDKLEKAAEEVKKETRDGRPPLLTPAIHEAIITAISTGMAETRVGPLLRMSKSIVGMWKDRGRKALSTWPQLTPEQQALELPYMEFFDDLIRAKPLLELSCLTIMQAAKDSGDARTAERILKMHFPEYRDTMKLVGDPTEPVATENVGSLTDEQRIARAKKARALLDATDGEDGG